MSASFSPAPGGRTPVYLVTGFLGSGKTTLLREIIKHPLMTNTALVVNELGEIGIDHMLLEKSEENLVLLNSGCLCCAMLNTLPETLADLEFRKARGEIPWFDRVIVETTGLAEPGPIIKTFSSHFVVAKYFELRSVITVADPVLGPGQLDRHPEVARQIAAADEMVLSKVDLAPASAVAAFRERIGPINPSARVHEVVQGRVADPVAFLNNAKPIVPSRSEGLDDWLGGHEHPEGHDHVLGHGDHHHHDHGHGAAHFHDDAVQSLSVELDEPTSWAGYACWVDLLRQLPSESLLRVKGVLHLRDTDKPVVIHGVQHTFYPPSFLDRWADAERKSRIVFITWKLDPRILERALDAFKVPAGSETKLKIEDFFEPR
jgi:G3E family GTPase